ncbi:hypothetical protein U9M48_000997 [Paspalum notatum var. saurae]|uniref:Uncharacterized protein n=1 Tax=Paspalum notatum var. saurae TaxID=547442 RepID=A0AAQ3PEG0_PASNO
MILHACYADLLSTCRRHRHTAAQQRSCRACNSHHDRSIHSMEAYHIKMLPRCRGQERRDAAVAANYCDQAVPKAKFRQMMTTPCALLVTNHVAFSDLIEAPTLH